MPFLSAHRPEETDDVAADEEEEETEETDEDEETDDALDSDDCANASGSDEAIIEAATRKDTERFMEERGKMCMQDSIGAYMRELLFVRIIDYLLLIIDR